MQNGAFLRRAVGHEVERQQQQDNRHHLDRDLRERQIRGREIVEPDRYHQADNPHQDQNRQTVAVHRHKETRRDHQHQPTGKADGRDGQHLARGGAIGACKPRMRPDGDDGGHEDGGVAGKGPVVQPLRYQTGKTHGRGDDTVKDVLGLGARCGGPKTRQRAEGGEQQQTTHHSNRRHAEGGHEAVPQLDMRAWHLSGRADDRLGHGAHKGFSQERCHTDHDHGDDQQGGGNPQPNLGVVGFGGVIVPLFAQEGMRNKPEAIRGREKRAERRHCRHQIGRAEQRGVQRLFQHHLFGQEPVEQRDTRHRQCGQRGNREGDRHQTAQAPQSGHIARVHRVIHDASAHEQGGLKARVVQNVEHRRHRPKGGARAQQEGDQPQMRHGGKCQQRLEVVFENRD